MATQCARSACLKTDIVGHLVVFFLLIISYSRLTNQKIKELMSREWEIKRKKSKFLRNLCASQMNFIHALCAWLAL